VHAIVADMERAGIETIHTLTDLPRKDTIETAFTPVSEKTEPKKESASGSSKK
jgi:hypothetical protein